MAINVALRVKRLVNLLVALIRPQAEQFPQTIAAVAKLKTASDLECVVGRRTRFKHAARRKRRLPDETSAKVWRQRHYRLKMKYDATRAALEEHQRSKTVGGALVGRMDSEGHVMRPTYISACASGRLSSRRRERCQSHLAPQHRAHQGRLGGDVQTHCAPKRPSGLCQPHGGETVNASKHRVHTRRARAR